ncbi:MAG: RagB/SusD family nutrient uptake outer membrane protein [Chitinophaga sp.]|uniref:RagB/SusD family nutrient uptake outer membrane protein n=1 Tax=Chitinophaga sp. TaxID=1869181 RepID=UPI001B1E65E5|nr:RagB/SusD family nutrient uptake outer membrane protein [Chitinophaga sp.]MBO9727269.1 RagB/SusD family nutrient uptake outer membrane protein [Chitinophaga sp.]
MQRIFSLLVLTGLLLTGCKNEPIPNPNAPTIDQVIKNPTIADLNNLVTGCEGGMRQELSLQIDILSIFGREYYRFSGSEPRWTKDLVGKEDFSLNPSSYYCFNYWLYRYNVVKNANLLLTGVKNSVYLSNDKQRNGYIAFAKTIMAYQLLICLNLTYENGIRTDVADPDKLGPFLTKDAAYTAIAQMLEDANTAMSNADFLFQLSPGFDGFSDVAGFRKFNRALAARVAVYRQKWTDALGFLQASFMNKGEGADLNTGVYHIYAAASGDLVNDLVTLPDGIAEIRFVQSSFAQDIDPADNRINKTSLRSAPITKDKLTSDRDFALYPKETSPVPIIRNEELILIYAEASLQTNHLTEAADALNHIRTAHGLTARHDLDTKEKLLDEMLVQRRFSLFGEGHRFIDMRRYNRLNTLPNDRPKDHVWQQLPLPAQDVQQ